MTFPSYTCNKDILTLFTYRSGARKIESDRGKYYLIRSYMNTSDGLCYKVERKKSSKDKNKTSNENS